MKKKDRTEKPKKTGTIIEGEREKKSKEKYVRTEGGKKIQSGKSKKVHLTGRKNKLK